MDRFWKIGLVLVVALLMALWSSHGVGLLIGAFTLSFLFLSWLIRHRSAERVREQLRADPSGLEIGQSQSKSWLRRWLFLAGFRGRSAPALFVTFTILTLVLGIGSAYMINMLGIVDIMVVPLRSIPGGIGEAFTIVAYATPWIVLSLMATLPLVIVRAARRQCVEKVDHDLPLLLELLATLTEGGLSFDAALDQILGAYNRPRPLAQEFQTYHRELQLGVSRLQALRRLASRLEVTSVTFLMTALIQSEQIGSSVAATLRRQADDLRNRRREHALMLAHALPVKMVFPLILCFLPGIFLSTLGPSLYQLVNLVSGITGGIQ